LYWAIAKAVGPNRKVGEFKKYVERHINHIKSGQTVLEIFSVAQERFLKKTELKRVAEAQLVQRLRENRAYVRRILGLIQDGYIGKDDSPYSDLSPRKSLSAFVNELGELNEHLKNLSPKKRLEARRVMDESTVVLGALLRNAPDTTKVGLFE